VEVEVEATAAALPAPLQERAEKLPMTFEAIPNAGLQANVIKSPTFAGECDQTRHFAGADGNDPGTFAVGSLILGCTKMN
jgi:hypothetical protein